MATDGLSYLQRLEQRTKELTATSETYEGAKSMAELIFSDIDKRYGNNRDTLADIYDDYSARASNANTLGDYYTNSLVATKVGNKLGKNTVFDQVGDYAQGLWVAANEGTANILEGLREYTNRLKSDDNFNVEKLYEVAKGTANAQTRLESGVNYLSGLRAQYPDSQEIAKLYDVVNNNLGNTMSLGEMQSLVDRVNEYTNGVDVQNFINTYTKDEHELLERQTTKTRLSYEGALPQALQTSSIVVGEMTPSILLARGAGGIANKARNALGLLASSKAGMAGSLTLLGLSAKGNQYREAISEGATPGQAELYSDLAMAAEVASEVIGGERVNALLGFGVELTPAGRMAKEFLDSTGITSDFVRFIVNNGAELTAEGFEEMTTAFLDPLFKQAVYGKEADWENLPGQILTEFVQSLVPTAVMMGLGQREINLYVNEMNTYLKGKVLESQHVSDTNKIAITKELDDIASKAKKRVVNNYDDLTNAVMQTFNEKVENNKALARKTNALIEKVNNNQNLTPEQKERYEQRIYDNAQFVVNTNQMTIPEAQDLGKTSTVKYQNIDDLATKVQKVSPDITLKTEINGMQEAVKSLADTLTGGQVVYVNAPQGTYGFRYNEGNDFFVDGNLSTVDTLRAVFHEIGHSVAEKYPELFNKFIQNGGGSNVRNVNMYIQEHDESLTPRDAQLEMFGDYLAKTATKAENLKKLEDTTATTLTKIRDMIFGKNSKVTSYALNNQDYQQIEKYLPALVLNNKVLEAEVVSALSSMKETNQVKELTKTTEKVVEQAKEKEQPKQEKPKEEKPKKAEPTNVREKETLEEKTSEESKLDKNVRLIKERLEELGNPTKKVEIDKAIADVLGIQYKFNDKEIAKYYKILHPDKIEFSKMATEKNKGKAVDSQGNRLTPAQIKFFINSVVRDDRGNLLVVYHGSLGNFNVFDKKKISSGADRGGEGDYGAGFYFTNEIKYSEGIVEGLNKEKNGTLPRPTRIQNLIDKYTKEYDKIQKEMDALLEKNGLSPRNDRDTLLAVNTRMNYDQKLVAEYTKLYEKSREIFKKRENLYNKYPLKAASNEGGVRAFYLNLKNPLRLDLYVKASNEITQAFWELRKNDLKFGDEEFEKQYEKAEQRILGKYGFTEETYELAREFADRVGDGYWGFGNPAEYGYDGVIAESFPGVYEYVVYEPNQIKEISNENPTSSDDVRYSRRNAEDNKDKIIANQLDEIVKQAEKIKELKGTNKEQRKDIAELERLLRKDNRAFQRQIKIKGYKIEKERNKVVALKAANDTARDYIKVLGYEKTFIRHAAASDYTFNGDDMARYTMLRTMYGMKDNEAWKATLNFKTFMEHNPSTLKKSLDDINWLLSPKNYKKLPKELQQRADEFRKYYRRNIEIKPETFTKMQTISDYIKENLIGKTPVTKSLLNKTFPTDDGPLALADIFKTTEEVDKFAAEVAQLRKDAELELGRKHTAETSARLMPKVTEPLYEANKEMIRLDKRKPTGVLKKADQAKKQLYTLKTEIEAAYGGNPNTPAMFFERNLQKGERNKRRVITAAYDFLKPFMQKSTALNGAMEMYRWMPQYEKLFSHKAEWEEWVKGTPRMPKSFILSLYLHRNNDQNMAHITGATTNVMIDEEGKPKPVKRAGGGIRMPNERLYQKATTLSDIADAYKAGRDYMLTLEQVDKLIATLTPEEKAFADQIKEFYKYSTDLINEVSNRVFNYDIATVENYFPIHTYMAKQLYSNNDVDIESLLSGYKGEFSNTNLFNQDNLKDRVDSFVPIYLENLVDVFQKSVNDISTFYGYAEPLRENNIVLNTAFKNADGKVETTIKEQMGAIDNDLMRDYNALVRFIVGSDGFGKRTFRNIQAMNTLTFNIGTWLTQPASFMNTIKYYNNVGEFVKALGNSHTKVNQMIREYYEGSGLDTSNIKNFDLMRMFIREATPILDSRAITFRIPGLSELVDKKFGDKAKVKFLQFFDDIAVSTIARMQIYATALQAEFGTTEYFEKLRDNLELIMGETQPDSAQINRANMFRNKNGLVQQMTLFGTPSNQIANNFVQTTINLKYLLKNGTEEQKAKAWSTFGKMVGGLVAANAWVALVRSLRDVVRADDEDEEKFERRFAAQFIVSMLSPTVIGDEIASWFMDKAKFGGITFYDTDTPDAAWFNNVFNVGDKIANLFNENMSPTKKIVDTIKAIGSVAPIDTRSLVHDVEAVLKYAFPDVYKGYSLSKNSTIYKAWKKNPTTPMAEFYTAYKATRQKVLEEKYGYVKGSKQGTEGSLKSAYERALRDVLPAKDVQKYMEILGGYKS